MSQPTTAMVAGELRTAPPGDYFSVCSFDKNHVVLRSRMPYHIVKCIKNFPGHNKMQCPYDATEYIDPDDFLEHILKCDSAEGMGTSSEKFELARLKESGSLCNSEREPPPFHHKFAPEPDEDWGGARESRSVVAEKILMSGVERDDDDSDEYLTKGVGRGTKKRPLGRAKILEILQKQYEERRALDRPRRSNTSTASTASAGQFDDK